MNYYVLSCTSLIPCTCVYSIGVITDATFHEFSANDYPPRQKQWRDQDCSLKLLHRDWFAGKDPGVVTLVTLHSVSM